MRRLIAGAVVGLLATAFGGEKPFLKAGFLTDTHVRPARVDSQAPEICARTRQAFAVFKAQGVDVIGHCGDLADVHYAEAYDYYRDCIETTYPEKATRPKLLYVYANHDVLDEAKLRAGKKGEERLMPYEEGFRDMQRRLGIEHWLFHREVVKGIPFLSFPQSFGLDGGIERVRRMLAETAAEFPGKPIVVMAHVAPAGTVYRSERWGYPNFRKVLDEYPQVISFSGHTHNSLRNERTIWQGTFTAVDVGCLEWWYGDGMGFFSDGAKSAYGVLVAEFYADRVVIRRFDVRDGREYRPDDPWTVTLPYRPEAARYAPDVRRAQEKKPSFPAGAKLELSLADEKATLTFPPAEDEDGVLHYAVRVEADGEPKPLVDSGTFSQFYRAPKDRTAMRTVTLEAARLRTGGTCRVSVAPVGFFGTEGAPLVATVNAAGGDVGGAVDFTAAGDEERVEWSFAEGPVGAVDVYACYDKDRFGVPYPKLGWKKGDLLKTELCEPGVWRWVATGAAKGRDGNALAFKTEPGRRYRVYRPLVGTLRDFRLTAKSGEAVTAEPPREGPRIVLYGSKAVSGAGASRPGLAWANQFARLLDIPVAVVRSAAPGAFSAADLPALTNQVAGGYVLQALDDVTDESWEPACETFVRKLAAAKPHVPIVLCGSHRPDVDGRRYDRFFQDLIVRLQAEDWEAWGGYIFFVPHGDLCPDGSDTMTSDGALNDIGQTTVARAIASVTEVACRKITHRTVSDLEHPLAKELDAWQRGGRWEPKTPQLVEKPAAGFHGRVAALEWIDGTNAVGPEGDRTWRAKAWRNERVHGQFVVWTDEPRSEVKLRAGDLVSASGARIPSARLTTRFVRYIYSWGRRVPVPRLRGDILDPAERVNLPERGYRPAWLTVDVPADAEPGLYRGTFSFRARTGEAVEFPVELEVIGRTLPEKNVFFLDLWQQPFGIAAYHHVKPLSPEHYKLLEPHFRELGAAGQKVITTWVDDAVWGRGPGSPRSLVKYLRHRDGSSTFDFTDFDRHVAFAKACGMGPQIHCYSLVNWKPSYFYTDAETGDAVEVKGRPGEEPWKDYWRPLLRALEAHAKEKGWLGDVYLALDEVGRDGETKAAAFLKETAPGLKIAMAGCELPERYGYTVDTYSMPLQGKTFLLPEMDEDIAARRKAGRITTFYICCWPLKPNAGFGSDLCEQQWLGLYAAYKRYDGMLRWAMHLWSRDPFFGELLYSQDWAFAGDYYLAYPGGAVSVRWEMIRDSIEDYRKIAALREAGEATPELEAALKDLDFPLVHTASESVIRKKVERVQQLLQKQ